MIDIQRPLFWHQGLFLQPQHFQLQDRCIQSSLAPLYDYLAPHFWGVGDLEIQKTALGIRSFSILSGSFLFPDGSFVVLNRNAVIEARSFDEAWIDGGKTLPVYIGIKKLNGAGHNVSIMEKFEGFAPVTTRFVSPADPEEIDDLHTGGPTGQVKRLYYLVKIFWGNEAEELGDYLLMQVANLERRGDEIVLSERFIPPSLVLIASDPLAKLVKEVRDQIAFRGHQLEELKTQRGIQTAEFGSRDMVYLLALRSLNRYIPALFHYTETRQVHPWAAYKTLREIIGELSSFSERVSVKGETGDAATSLPAYDHRNLWACFSIAQSLIARLLDEITAGPDYVIKLLFDGTYYGADLKPAVFEGRNRFYLVARTHEDHKTIIPLLTGIAKLSSREHLPILIAHALPGIGLEHLPVPPQELPRRAHAAYLAVDAHNEQWNMVKKGANIALYWDNAPDDLDIDLMVVSR